MQIKTLTTHRITSEDSLFPILDAYVPTLREQSILVITSKIISLCEGSIVDKSAVVSKEALIHKSADAYLDYTKEFPIPYSIQLTIKNNILIPSAGIDESNGNGVYILYPKDVQKSAISVWEYLRKRDNLQQLGVIITDSHTTPMRRGVIGIGLGWCGFSPTYNYIGKPDCFGALLRVTLANALDALAAAAVYCMGEGNEQTPIAVIQEAPKITFQSIPPTQDEIKHFCIPMEEDLYAPLLKNARWIFNNR
ncbi:MAG TPA: putative folate metabolism gamma-glutamate ligase [Chlamydiales bacterium]|jgi:putative folate metabolism gamma-glutamate ligase|nr:putative folate metabolism gamma-glutamate ligase [Chlamydiales bacterium]